MRAEPIFGGTASKVAGPDSNWVTAGDPGCCLDGFPAPVCAKEMVTLQMSAGQMQMEFVCANDASRRRLRAAAQRELGPMASRLGCPVQVTLRADGPDAGAAAGGSDDAEHLHAAA